jgi:hypothetical protein
LYASVGLSAFFFVVLDSARCLSNQICAGKKAGALGDKLSANTIFSAGIGPEASVTAGNPILAPGVSAPVRDGFSSFRGWVFSILYYDGD